MRELCCLALGQPWRDSLVQFWVHARRKVLRPYARTARARFPSAKQAGRQAGSFLLPQEPAQRLGGPHPAPTLEPPARLPAPIPCRLPPAVQFLETGTLAALTEAGITVGAVPDRQAEVGLKFL